MITVPTHTGSCPICVYSFHYTYAQIADFGMACDVADDKHDVTTGGKIPVKWTPPEVDDLQLLTFCRHVHYRQYFTKDTQCKVMYGVLDV